MQPLFLPLHSTAACWRCGGDKKTASICKGLEMLSVASGARRPLATCTISRIVEGIAMETGSMLLNAEFP